MPLPKTIKTEWDLTPLLDGDDDPKVAQYRQAVTKAVDTFVATWRQRTDYLKDPVVAKAALDEMEALERVPGHGTDAFYYGLRTTQDSIDANLKAKDNQATEFSKEIYNKLEFFWLRLGAIDVETQTRFLADEDLAPYRHVLERTFAEARYRLSEAEEKIMVLKSSAAHSNWVQMVDNFLSREERKVLDENGKSVKANLEMMMGLTESKQKNVRDAAGKALDHLFAEHGSLGEVELNSILGNKKVDDELRGYERPDQARHVSDDIDTDVVEAMCDAVSQRNELAQRFYQLKAKLLGVPSLRYHERSVGYGAVDQSYSFEEAATLVNGVFHELDPEFAAIFERFLSNGNIDVYPQKGKRSGAYCAYYHITHPTYVFLNFTGKLSDVSTIAHEMGHAINDELMRQKQNALTYATPTSTAEVASTFMEDFIFERLTQGVDDEARLSSMLDKLGRDISTIFRQVAIYRFEQELHQTYRTEGYVTLEMINALFKKYMESYMGPASEGCENWWVYWSHIRNFFYVYSYASGQLISKVLQSKVRKDKSFIKEVKTFLSAGISKSPKDIFSDMGIDITDKNFWEQGLDEIEQLLDETEALAKKLGKI